MIDLRSDEKDPDASSSPPSPPLTRLVGWRWSWEIGKAGNGDSTDESDLNFPPPDMFPSRSSFKLLLMCPNSGGCSIS